MNNPMIPHTIVLEPGLIVFKIYNGYWYSGRRRSKSFDKTYERFEEVPSGLGQH
jgi:hypothetical protein